MHYNACHKTTSSTVATVDAATFRPAQLVVRSDRRLE
jgi:hypothetical protein